APNNPQLNYAGTTKLRDTAPFLRLPILNESRLFRPGQIVNVQITIPELRVFGVPREALDPFSKTEMVWIVTRDSRALLIPVVVIRRLGEVVYLASGQLQEGSIVIIRSPRGQLRSGQAVVPDTSKER